MVLPSGKSRCRPVPYWTVFFPNKCFWYLKMYLKCSDARNEEELHITDSSLKSSPGTSPPFQNPTSSTPHKEKWQVKTTHTDKERYNTRSLRATDRSFLLTYFSTEFSCSCHIQIFNLVIVNINTSH